MMYIFTNIDHTQVQRDDGAFVPWDADNNQPLDINGHAGRLWKYAGSPTPDPYVPPVVTRWEIPKSVIISRLTDEQLDTVMAAMTTRQKERWRSPDSPTVWNDNEE